MSMSAHGRSTLCWVCRCSRGFWSTPSPAIHIFAGEKVCIQVMTPMHDSSELASSMTRRISSGVVRTGLATTSTGIAGAPSSPATMSAEFCATWAIASSP